MGTLLEYLVPSRARRCLLDLLWRRKMTGSVRELAGIAGVAPSAAERELALMQRFELVSVERVGVAKIVRANSGSPHARMVAALLDAPEQPATKPTHDSIRTWLSQAGAPVLPALSPAQAGPVPSLAELTALAVRAAREDASIARVLPVFLWKNRAGLDAAELVLQSRRADVGRFVGFFLDLTAQLTGHRSFARVADRLRDRRVRRHVYFFRGTEESDLAREVAEMRAPPVARKWHLFMNMPFDSFETMFRKAVPDDELIRSN